MATATTSSAFDAFRATGAELRQLAAAGFAPAQAEIARRAASGKGGYVRTSLRAGVKPACWNHAEPTVEPVQAPMKAKAPKGLIASLVAAVQPGKVLVAPKGEPAPVPTPKPKRDTIAAVRADLAVTNANVAKLAASVEKLAEAVSARMVA